MGNAILDIIILLILSIIANSNFYAPYVSLEVYYAISICLKLVYIVFLYFYIHKYHTYFLEYNRPRKRWLWLLPLLLLPFSNIIVGIASGTYLSLATSSAFYVVFLAIIEQLLIVIVEELIFRVIFFNYMKHVMTLPQAILLSALLFGLTHLFNLEMGNLPAVLLQVVYSFVLGIILALILHFTHNIVVPIVFHFLFNVINGLIVYLLFALEYGVIYFVVNIGIGVLSLLYSFFLYRRFLE